MDKLEENQINTTEIRPEELPEEEQLAYYREAYFRERKKAANLAGRLSDANAQVEDLSGKLERIKGSGIWKLAKPLRSFYHLIKRTKERVGNYGSPKGIARKIRNKMIEKRARTQHGTASFPTPEEAARQRETKFPREIRFSILVPLYNTPRKD